MKSSIFNLGIIAVKLGPKLAGVFFKFGLAGTSLALYSYLWTWEFALSICVMLFIHEYGHTVAMRHCGLKVKGIYFIPLLGGVAIGEGITKKNIDDVYIALMGPIYGLGISFVTALAYEVTGNALFAAAAAWMALVNIFNLLPALPLDGGHVFRAIILSSKSTKQSVCLVTVCLASIAIVSILTNFYIFAILSIVLFIELYFDYRAITRNSERMMIAKQRAMDTDLITISLVSYALVVGLLLAVMWWMSSVPAADAARQILMGT